MPSFDRPAQPESGISSWFQRFAHLLSPRSAVLDLAAGYGRHTRWALSLGCRVVAVDIDVGGLEDLSDRPDAEIITADLEQGDWPLGDRRFDAVLISNYLHRPHFARIPGMLRDGGLLMIDTFGAGNQRYGRPRNPDFLLQPGELLDAWAGQLQVVAYEQGIEYWPRPAVRQRICAQAGAGPVALAPRPAGAG
jgi:SAM-dependent methyltransferase